MIWFALATYKSKIGTAPAIVIDTQMYDLKAAIKAARIPGFKADSVDGGVASMMSDWATFKPLLRKAAPVIVEQAAAGKLKSLGLADKLAVAPYRPHASSAQRPTSSSMRTR